MPFMRKNKLTKRSLRKHTEKVRTTQPSWTSHITSWLHNSSDALQDGAARVRDAGIEQVGNIALQRR